MYQQQNELRYGFLANCKLRSLRQSTLNSFYRIVLQFIKFSKTDI